MTTQNADQQAFNNELRGALFKNDKGDNPARPDYRGNCVINGQRYKISAWIRKARSGMTFMSMAYTLDEPTPETAASVAASETTAPVTAADFAAQAPDEEPPF
jgi:uncharacterized protein (DUF736 family)